MRTTYDQLKRHIQELHAAGIIDGRLTDEQRVDWAYGNTKIENDSITREMCDRAVRMKSDCLHDVCGSFLCRKCSPGYST